MAVEAQSAILRWPNPDEIDLEGISWFYNSKIDLLELSFTRKPVWRVETPLETTTKFWPMASVRDDEEGRLTGEVVGVMIDNLSEAFPEHPDWRILTEGKIDRDVLTSLIETLSVLPEYADDAQPS